MTNKPTTNEEAAINIVQRQLVICELMEMEGVPRDLTSAFGLISV